MLRGGFFITGTDTGVGKTIIGAGLIRFLKALGYSVYPLKPAETGCNESDGALIPHDGNILLEATELELSIKEVVPFRYSSPVAPMVAAEQESRPFSIERLMNIIESVKQRYHYLVVEGAGGVMVPLSRDLLTIDLIELIGLPVIVVAANRLGVINHTLLTVEALQKRGIQVKGIILNNINPDDDDISRKTNKQVLSRILHVPFLGEMPYLRKKDFKSLHEAFVKHLDTSHLL